jgi:hypothetical protein
LVAIAMEKVRPHSSLLLFCFVPLKCIAVGPA